MLSAPAITTSPLTTLQPATSRIANAIWSRTAATRSSISRTGMAVTLGNAATTAGCTRASPPRRARAGAAEGAGGDGGGGGAVEGAGREHHEEVGVEALPVDPPDVHDPAGDGDALDVEREAPAEADAEEPRDLLLHRDQRLPRRLLGGPPAARHQRVLARGLGRPRQHGLAAPGPRRLA